MKKQGSIEVLARGVCVKAGRLLVCHTLGAANTYLPGGHVEFLESAPQSLVREIAEEMGLKARAGRFLGAVEHSFVQRGERHCEVNLVFAVAIVGVNRGSAPPSREKHIEFLWLPLKSLAESNLEPAVLRALLPKWLRHRSSTERWGSTCERRCGS